VRLAKNASLARKKNLASAAAAMAVSLSLTLPLIMVRIQSVFSNYSLKRFFQITVKFVPECYINLIIRYLVNTRVLDVKLYVQGRICCDIDLCLETSNIKLQNIYSISSDFVLFISVRSCVHALSYRCVLRSVMCKLT
jgi:hypothetical protein